MPWEPELVIRARIAQSLSEKKSEKKLDKYNIAALFTDESVYRVLKSFYSSGVFMTCLTVSEVQ